VIFAGANRVSAAFQLRFSCVSAAFQLRFSCVSATFQLTRRFFSETSFFGPKISAFLKVKLLVKLFFVFQMRFSWQKRGAHPLKFCPVSTGASHDRSFALFLSFFL
jgi:hypothetical protein